jgi:hypothetical protein
VGCGLLVMSDGGYGGWEEKLSRDILKTKEFLFRG